LYSGYHWIAIIVLLFARLGLIDGLDMTLVCLRILFFAYFCFSSFGAASLAVFEIDELS
jgi:hypothetical protein